MLKGSAKIMTSTECTKKLLLDFSDAKSQTFMDTFGEPISNLLHGCSVHFIHSAMCIAKLVDSSIISPGYHIFMVIVKCIPDKPSKDVVQDAFEVLCGAKSFEILSRYHIMTKHSRGKTFVVFADFNKL